MHLKIIALTLIGILLLQKEAAALDCNIPGPCVENINKSNPFNNYPFKIPTEFNDTWKNYRTEWSRLTGFELSGLHWQQFVVVYLNKGRDRYKQNYGEYVKFYVDEEYDDEENAHFQQYEPGTVFLKENYMSKNGLVGDPISITSMIKREPGYDPKHNDWEYIQSSVDGKVLIRGKFSDPAVKSVCAECHGNMEERDFVFSTYYSE